MSSFLSYVFSSSFLHAVLRISTPLVAGTLAAYIANKAGLVNIAIEGMMLMAALFGVLLSAAFGPSNVVLAFIVVVVIGALIGLVMGVISEVLDADIFLTGLALNMIAKGLTAFLLFMASGDKGSSSNITSYAMPIIDIPFIKDIPVLGNILSGHNVVTYISYILVVVMFIFVNKTKTGLRIRATGENEKAAQTVGINTLRLKLLAISLSGALAAIGGAFLSMGYMKRFTRDMTAGRGFISLSASAMSGGSALGGTLVSLLFGVTDALSNWIQQASTGISHNIVLAMPYFFVIVALVIYNITKIVKAKRKMTKLEDKDGS